jgi:hypothetical protein
VKKGWFQTTRRCFQEFILIILADRIKSWNRKLGALEKVRRGSGGGQAAASAKVTNLNPSKVDAEDPRCTKLSISGMFKKVSADDVSIPLPVDFLYLMVPSCTLIIRKKVNTVVPYAPNTSILNSVQLWQTRCDNLTWKLYSYLDFF